MLSCCLHTTTRPATPGLCSWSPTPSPAWRRGVCGTSQGRLLPVLVDETWRVPHFEKRLYYNAQLAPVYLACGLTTGDASMLRVARETCSSC